MSFTVDSSTSALAIASAIRARIVSSTEIVEHYLRVIERKNPEIAAFTQILSRRARMAARLADGTRAFARARRRGRFPAFYGVPTALKDDSPMRLTYFRVGSRALRYVVAPLDGMLAKACRSAGFVMTGKLSTSEMTILPFVHTDFQPPTRNPHDLTRYSGGSSGGSGAAVASGMLPIAPGSDGAGSIRIPSAFCGLFGFKASRGAVVHPFAELDIAGLSTLGPLAKNARDAAALLDVLAGDPYFHEAPRPGSYLAACNATVRRGLRIKMCTTSPLVEVEPEIRAAVERAARALTEMGHVVEEAPAIDADVDGFLPLMQKITSSAPLPPFTHHVLQPVTQWMRVEGKRHRRDDVMEQQRKLEARVLAQFADADYWLTPTVARLAPLVGAYEGLGGEATLRAVVPIGAFTAPFNVSGQPAASIPAGKSSGGVPIGVQLVGRRDEDRALFALAARLEEALASPPEDASMA
jgi:amidase